MYGKTGLCDIDMGMELSSEKRCILSYSLLLSFTELTRESSLASVKCRLIIFSAERMSPTVTLSWEKEVLKRRIKDKKTGKYFIAII